ncbi:hypothetical protein B0H21DRAFT_754136 [Amylocystis lapponica]|nr:hypothetical protein B0H21DRAFT_754136 [Amylocystis lapponica]
MTSSSTASSFSDSKVAQFYGLPDPKCIEITALKPPPFKKRKAIRKLFLKNQDLSSQGVVILPEYGGQVDRPLSPMVFGPSDAVDDIAALGIQKLDIAAESASVDIPLEILDSPDTPSFPQTPLSLPEDASSLSITRPTPREAGRLIPSGSNEDDVAPPSLPTGTASTSRHACPSSASIEDISFSRPSPVESLESLASANPASKIPHGNTVSLCRTPPSDLHSPMVFASINPHIAVTPAPPMSPLFPRRHAKAPPVNSLSSGASLVEPQTGPSRTPTSRLKRMTSQSRFFNRRAFSVSDLRDPSVSAEKAASTASVRSAESNVTLTENGKGVSIGRGMSALTDVSRKGVEVTMMAENGRKELAVNDVIPSLRRLRSPARTKLW